MKEESKKLIKTIKKYLREAVDIAVPVLCLGIVVQLIVGDTILGWDPIQNIQRAINSLGQSNFIGVAALLVLYSVFKKQ
jgi:TRAP-type uncharacterized transport system fused permease subunit